MIVAIRHSINDPKKWEEVGGKIRPMVEEGRLPEGLKALLYLPSTDGRQAHCLMEAGSVDQVKRFLEPLTAVAARSEYFQINVDQAFGLPALTREQVATH